MKTFAALMLLAGSAAAADVTYGEHGMALFGGKDGLYASHLPMFHAPHDYQVVLQVHVADPATDAALRQRLDGKTALWTIAPEKFELSRLAPQAARPLKRFNADLVLGHFEQGGKTQYAASTIVVDKILMFRKLSPEASASSTANYMQIGSGVQRYLVKQIDSRPDYDHIVAYRATPGTSAEPVTLIKQALRQPSPAELAVALHTRGDAIGGTIYFYTDDLK
ncbi:hypothetical protein GTP58_22045 [Duganella sp. CY15W]|uniref:hypothetical protein n=1 Tax=Duganella sp. CY15W TaxID=2692172 RepID=UPI00136A961B|nr:hypothetical protein [Duganella sp. CY15W]MYM31025.1 hypothetical protein [Duganella sp. CY15W]